MNVNKLFKTPWGIYFVWIVLFIIFVIIGIPILGKGHSGGDQVPLSLLGYSLNVLIYGLAVISIITPMFYNAWVKKNWYVNFIVGLTSLIIILYVQLYNK